MTTGSYEVQGFESGALRGALIECLSLLWCQAGASVSTLRPQLGQGEMVACVFRSSIMGCVEA